MILKLKKPTLFFSLGLSLLLALSFLAIDKTTLSSLDDDVIQFFVSMDFGFSHPENLIELRNKEYPYPSSSTELSSNRIQKILAVLSSTPRILKYKFRDLSMERIDINVPFL